MTKTEKAKDIAELIEALKSERRAACSYQRDPSRVEREIARDEESIAAIQRRIDANRQRLADADGWIDRLDRRIAELHQQQVLLQQAGKIEDLTRLMEALSVLDPDVADRIIQEHLERMGVQR